MKLYDWSRKDKCEPVVGELFPGGYALVTGGPKDFLGKMVLLTQLDRDGYWECFDSSGDLLILEKGTLMPVSEKGWDDCPEIEQLVYRVGDAA